MKKIKNIIKPLIFIIIILFVWYIVCKAQILSPYVLPSPKKVFDTFVIGITSGDIFQDVFISFVRVMRGFSIAFILAFTLAMLEFFKTWYTKLL